MQFNNFLGAYYRDTSYGGDRLYADMLAQASWSTGWVFVASPSLSTT